MAIPVTRQDCQPSSRRLTRALSLVRPRKRAMTRVLHVLDHSLPLHSGYTFRTRAILKAQQATGLEVRGITGLRHYRRRAASPEEADGLTFHRTPRRGGRPGGPARMARDRAAGRGDRRASAQNWRPDVLHAHSPALCGAAALRVAQAAGHSAGLRNPRLLGRCRGRQRHRQRRLGQIPPDPHAGKPRRSPAPMRW